MKPLVITCDTCGRPGDQHDPDCTFQQKMFRVLDHLHTARQPLRTTMYGAAPYLVEVFNISLSTARMMIEAWMNTYETRHGVKLTDTSVFAAARVRSKVDGWNQVDIALQMEVGEG